VKLSTERKHLTNVLKLVAYQIESDLVNSIRPHYTRTDDEGRTLIQTALQCAATLEPSGTELCVTRCALSSAHRSQAVAALCETLNRSETCFPGTQLRMNFRRRRAPKMMVKADRLPRGYVRSSELTTICNDSFMISNRWYGSLGLASNVKCSSPDVVVLDMNEQRPGADGVGGLRRSYRRILEQR
jgi:hypothetical protein